MGWNFNLPDHKKVKTEMVFYFGIDRATRAASTSSGCIVIGFEPFVFPANNAAIIFLTHLFGYQRGAYPGVFPTHVEAKEIIKTADTVTAVQTDKYYQFNTANQIVSVDTSDFYRFGYSFTPLEKVVGKIINNECFIFRQSDSKDNENGLYLVDIKKSKLLFQY